MRIAMIGPKSIPAREGSGGIERHVDELSVRLAAKHEQVVVYIRRRFADTQTTDYRDVTRIGVSSIVTKHLDTFSYTFFATMRTLFRPYDIIHYHGIGPATLAWIPRLFKPRARVIVTFHSLDRFHKKWGWFARLFLRFAEWAAVTFPHETIAVSRGIQEYVAEHFHKRITYIPNGAAIAPYPGEDMLGTWGLKKEEYILMVSRFAPQKGIHYLIEAYLGLKTDKKLVIAGASDIDDRYGRRVREMVKGHDSIILTGFQSGKALAELYANTYIYVHPSEAEGLSLSILEAMAAGRCVLVSDIPENIEAVGTAGETFASASVDDLRSKLFSLLTHPDVVREKGAASLRRAKNVYGWDHIVAQTEVLYHHK